MAESTQKEPTPPPQPESRGGLFSRRKSNSPPRHDSHTSNSSGGKLGGLLGRDKEDKSVTAARERVRSAEASEARAEKALQEAKLEVREAKAHASRLEKEAAEE